MSNVGSHVYHGIWINWSHGRIQGSTITLSERDGGLLTAFLALFVTIMGGQLWRILSFVIHHTRASRDPRDGFHHQQLVVFRNATSPCGAAWTFAQMPVYWWSTARRPLLRSLPWIILSLIYTATFSVAGIFSSAVIKAAGNDTLIISASCGDLIPDGPVGNLGQDKSQTGVAFRERMLENTFGAADYARACYTDPSIRSQLRCQIYMTSQLPYERDQNASCPFAKGICLISDTAALRMDTGLLDSHAIFGINTPQKDRVTYRRVTTCAPITTEGFMSYQNTTRYDGSGEEKDDRLINYNYGPVLHSDGTWYNYTDQYRTPSLQDAKGYLISIELNLLNITASWRPVPQLNRNDADVTLLSVNPNGVQYPAPSDDPFFPVHTLESVKGLTGKNDTYYVSDNPVNFMGCIDQDQICNPFNGKCTPLSGQEVLLKAIDECDMSDVQKRISERIYFATGNTRMGHIGNILSNAGMSMRAQEKVWGILSAPLPPDQWIREASWWFNIGLAKLQRDMVEYATGPSTLYPGYRIERPDDEIGKRMCNNQKMRSTEKSISFSTLGISIILAIGGIVIFINVFIDTIFDFIQQRFLHRGHYRNQQWILNEALQLQRLAFEGVGMGKWSGTSSFIPVTRLGEQLDPFSNNESKEALISAATTTISRTSSTNSIKTIDERP